MGEECEYHRRDRRRSKEHKKSYDFVSLVHPLDYVGLADLAQAWRNAGPKSRGELVAALPQFKLMLRGVLPENGRWGALGEISMAVVTNDVVHDVQTLRLLRAFLKTDGWEARLVGGIEERRPIVVQPNFPRCFLSFFGE